TIGGRQDRRLPTAACHALGISQPYHAAKHSQHQQRQHDQQRQARAFDIVFVLGTVEHPGSVPHIVSGLVNAALVIGHCCSSRFSKPQVSTCPYLFHALHGPIGSPFCVS